jgi:Cdc6-like AAA superfamily ATPase
LAHSRLGLHRLTFEPYKHDQLVTIVNSRLNDLNVFNVCRSLPPLLVFRHYIARTTC